MPAQKVCAVVKDAVFCPILIFYCGENGVPEVKFGVEI